MWDQEKGVACRPRLASDGMHRCLPGRLQGSLLFTDSTCTRAVINRDPAIECSGSSQYFADVDSVGPCATDETRIYTAGAEVDAPGELYPHNGNPCSLLNLTVEPPPRGPFYEAVPSDPSEWTLLTEEVVPLTEALAVVIWTGTDGSRIPHELRLRSTGVPCEKYAGLPDSQFAFYCAPKTRAHESDVFPDDGCTGKPLFGACAPTDVIEPDHDTGGVLLEANSEVLPVFFKTASSPNECKAVPPDWISAPNPSVFYTPGSVVDLERYPPLVSETEGSDRVLVEYVTSDGKNVLVEGYFDTKYERGCHPTTLAGRGAWCVSGALDFTPDDSILFADAECARPVATFVLPAFDPELPPPFQFALVLEPGHACNPSLQPSLHSLVDYYGPLFQRIAPGQCVPAPALDPGTGVYEPGAALDPAEVFARMPDSGPNPRN